MREFSELFPENGIYVVVTPFQTENLIFIPGEPVGIIRWGDTPYVRITKTGRVLGGYANYMEVEHMAKIKKLDAEEISQLANGKIFTADMFQDIKSMAKACKAITGLVSRFRPHLNVTCE